MKDDLVWCLLLLTMLGGCASEGLYEGFKVREATRDSLAQGSVRSTLPSYHDYERERGKLLDSK